MTERDTPLWGVTDCHAYGMSRLPTLTVTEFQSSIADFPFGEKSHRVGPLASQPTIATGLWLRETGHREQIMNRRMRRNGGDLVASNRRVFVASVTEVRV